MHSNLNFLCDSGDLLCSKVTGPAKSLPELFSNSNSVDCSLQSMDMALKVVIAGSAKRSLQNYKQCRE